MLGGGIRTAPADFAEVLRRVREVRSVSYDLVHRPLGQPEERARVQVAGGRTRVTWSDGRIHIFDEALHKILTLSPDSREARLVRSAGTPYCDLLRSLRSISALAGTYVGREKTDGREAKVYQVTMVEGVMRMWVDPHEELPVRVEMRTLTAMGRQPLATMDRFVWNLPIPDSVFCFEVPVGYTLKELDAEPSESDLVRVLGICAAKSGGAFPGGFDARVVVRVVLGDEDGMRTADMGDALSVTHVNDEAKATLRDCLAGLAFVERIRETGTWRYVGGGVRSGDATAELCWWTSPGSTTRRVVYGDLRVQDAPLSNLPSEELRDPNDPSPAGSTE
jgi:hypothetical protein